MQTQAPNGACVAKLLKEEEKEAYPGYFAGLYGRVAERLKAPSLYLGVGVSSTYRGFESCPVRQLLGGNRRE